MYLDELTIVPQLSLLKAFQIEADPTSPLS